MRNYYQFLLRDKEGGGEGATTDGGVVDLNLPVAVTPEVKFKRGMAPQNVGGRIATTKTTIDARAPTDKKGVSSNGESMLTLSVPALFLAKCKSFFFRKFIASLVFMLERYIR